MGKGAQEKTEIAHFFLERCRNLGLKLDIGTEENERLYGDHWYMFLAECRACLGVEAGASIFDVNDKVRRECERLIADNPRSTFKEMFGKILRDWEGNIYYRTIASRHFEAAAFKVCQILFEGKYSGIMQPMVHYIPLKKDFSNFNEVIRLFRNEGFRRDLTESAYRDLIASGKYSYEKFMDGFDCHLLNVGIEPEIDELEASRVTESLARWRIQSSLLAFVKMVRYFPYPGKSLITRVVKPVLFRYLMSKEKQI